MAPQGSGANGGTRALDPGPVGADGELILIAFSMRGNILNCCLPVFAVLQVLEHQAKVDSEGTLGLFALECMLPNIVSP